MNWWNCPACYAQIDPDDAGDVFEDEGSIPHTCAECGHKLEICIDLEPVYTARLADDQEADDED
ncbi:conserved hypothetical protein [Roseibium sp. TrichSKD4]|nr:conserved hypothetical protein [Roseibium sp. TrichSKD4]